MPYCELLRMTTLLSAGAATALASITVLVADNNADTTTLIVALGWWVIAVIIGVFLGSKKRAADSVREVLVSAKTATSLPSGIPGRIALGRLLPIVAFALVAGGAGIVAPGVSAIGTGYAIAFALAWRSREQAVLAIEERDGVRFYLDSGSPFDPIKLTRTPGLRRGPSAKDAPGFE